MSDEWKLSQNKKKSGLKYFQRLIYEVNDDSRVTKCSAD